MAHSSKRGNGEGTIYQRPNGTWCGQVLLGYSPTTGKAIRKTFYGKTRSEVARSVAQETSQVFLGIGAVNTGTVSLERFIHDYLWTFKKPALADSTFAWYLNVANCYIIPKLGQKMIKDITPTLIQRLINYLEESGHSRRTIKAARDLLNQTFKHAVQTRTLVYNPVTPTVLPKERKQGDLSGERVKVVPKEERGIILAAAESDPRMKFALTLLMMTGMRTGELLALQWQDIDFETGTIFIRNAITFENEYDDNGKVCQRKTVIGDTKTTGSVRKIYVPPEVINVIKEWQEYLPQHVLKSCSVDILAPDAVVFPTVRGVVRTYNGFRTTYRRFMKDHGLTEYPLHTYRHTFATMLLEENVNPKVVQELLGHRDVETTLNTYSHVLPDVLINIAGLLGDLYNSTH